MKYKSPIILQADNGLRQMTEIETNLNLVKKRLTELGRPDVRIIAVSKTHGPERIAEFLRIGQRDFGENRQNEARDKFPLVDNVLDTLQTFVKPCAGALLMASVVADWSPLYLTVVWIIMGGAMAGAVHVTKAKLRLVSTATTAGFGNPALSLTEDVGALAGTAVSIVAPVIVVVLVVVSLTLTWILLRRRRALPSR